MKRLIVAMLATAVCAITLHAQRASKPPVRPAAKPAAPRTERAVPFNVGETLTYDVSWSAYLTAGTAVTTVKDKKASFNSTAYYIVAEGRPTPLLQKLYTLYYKLDTLIDSFTLLPQRGSSYSEEGKRHRLRTTQFDRTTNKAHFELQTTTLMKEDIPVSPVAQDALSAMYVLRAIPFKAGDRMTMPVTDNGTTYKAQFDIAASEKIRAPIGEVSAWRIKASIVDAKGQPVGRNIAIWVSDDARRLPVKLQAELPVGSFNLILRDAR
jgi:hypothetical protein